MQVKLVAVGMFGLLVTGVARPLTAQSLVDVARKEEERRRTLKAPAPVITNRDLAAPSTPPATSGTPATASSTAKDADKSKNADKDKNTDKDKNKDAKEPVKDQAYWSGRLKQLQTQLDQDQTYSAALQSRINSLSTDFTSRDDPAQRAVVERDRQKNIAELNKLKEAIAKGKTAIADLGEEARRAGVPPGWLR